MASYAIHRVLTPPGSDGVYGVAPGWEDFFRGSGNPYLLESGGDGLPRLTLDGTTYPLSLSQGNVAAFAETAAEYARTQTPTADAVGTDTGSVEWMGLELGAYLVIAPDALPGFCTLTEEQPIVRIIVKDREHFFDKKIVGDQSVDEGRFVSFRITDRVPDTTGCTDYLWQAQDVMDRGLTYSEATAQMSVTIDGVPITDAVVEPFSCEHNGETKTGFRVTIPVMEHQAQKGKEIVITYRAALNAQAVCTLTENHARLRYGSDPDIRETPWVDVPVWANRIVIDKCSIDNEEEKLSGAVFVLVKKSPGQELYFREDAQGNVEWTSELARATVKITEADGSAVFSGLADGDYWLREIRSPAGYSLLDQDVKLSPRGKADPLQAGKIVGVSLGSQIGNSDGKDLLPTTGGPGTTPFVVLGALLFASSALLLLCRRRKAAH